MKFCIAIQEVLRKEVIVEAENSLAAFEKIEILYNAGMIILDADNWISDPLTGDSVKYQKADWHSNEEIQNMKVTFPEEKSSI